MVGAILYISVNVFLEVVLTAMSMEYKLNTHFRDVWEHEAIALAILNLCYIIVYMKSLPKLIQVFGLTSDLPKRGVGISGGWPPTNLCPVLHDEVPAQSNCQACQSCSCQSCHSCPAQCTIASCVRKLWFSISSAFTQKKPPENDRDQGHHQGGLGGVDPHLFIIVDL